MIRLTKQRPAYPHMHINLNIIVLCRFYSGLYLLKQETLHPHFGCKCLKFSVLTAYWKCIYLYIYFFITQITVFFIVYE